MGRRRFRGRPDWVQGKEALWDVLTQLGEDRPEIGWLDFVGKGLFFTGLHTEVELAGELIDVVVRVPHSDAGEDEPEDARREITVREKLLDAELPFEIPEPLGCAETDHGLAIVDRWVPGASLGEKVVQSFVDPVEVTAVTAAGVHNVDPEPFRDFVRGEPTRRAHAERVLDVLEQDESPEFRDARQWVEEHLPPPTPSRLLHGDLLGQNILITVDWQNSENWRASVIDWHGVRMGDPAYDLAIVSRGHRKVFRGGESLQQLVAAYNRQADETLDVTDVRIFELWLKASFYLNEREESGRSAHADQLFKNFRAVWKRV